VQADSTSFAPSLSADGRFVAFASGATNLIAGVQQFDVYTRDRLLNTIERDSVDSLGNQAIGAVNSPTISADGRYVVLPSQPTNLDRAASNGKSQIFLHDRTTGITELISQSSAGIQGDGPSALLNDWSRVAVSADGRYVAFDSQATNLVPNDTNTCPGPTSG